MSETSNSMVMYATLFDLATTSRQVCEKTFTSSRGRAANRPTTNFGPANRTKQIARARHRPFRRQSSQIRASKLGMNRRFGKHRDCILAESPEVMQISGKGARPIRTGATALFPLWSVSKVAPPEGFEWWLQLVATDAGKNPSFTMWQVGATVLAQVALAFAAAAALRRFCGYLADVAEAVRGPDR
eukprot:scaffold138019_cov38-Prasinocladus_malaysianus.AAC.1